MKYLTTDLSEIAHVRHGFFTRQGGVSGALYASLNCGFKKDDAEENVNENRARAAAALDLAPDRLVIARQVHGTRVVAVEKSWTPEEAPDADGMVTAERGLGLGVLTADCTPVLFAAKKKKVIGACHAGWKGALAGIIGEMVAAMKKLGVESDDIVAALGPCIGPESYEVRDDFAAPFLAQHEENERFFKASPKPGHRIFDLPGYVGHRLAQAGVDTVYDTRRDTLVEEVPFFSNRRAFLRSEKDFGLQVSVISIK